MNGSWHLVLPVKAAEQAKSRLAVAEGVSRPRLARAMALDTLAAVLGCDLVAGALVVTSDTEVAAAALEAGALVRPDPGAGLNSAIASGLEELASPGTGGPVGVLLADLPSLRAGDLGHALAACAAYDVAFVPDAEGTGTVLLTGAQPALLRPEFGERSAERHALQAKRLDLDLPRLRRDVDLAESLRDALALGVGPLTTAALRGDGEIIGRSG